MTTFEQVRREAKLRHEKAQGGRAGEYLTVRDYFAAKAMQTFMQGARMPQGYDATSDLAAVASRSYEAADAMMKAREA